ncbi:MAG TPA: nuclear transport factor 2 family protein [Mycobacterium sp.]|nr:nuclear transport factor 2 family protein [Mycobacterium sp.]
MDADKEQITEVLIRYATGIDSKDWPLFRSCWTDEIDADYQQLGRFSSADALTEVMTRLHENMGPTYHRLSNFVIAVDGDRATARSYVQAVLMLQPDDSTNWVDATGHYDDVLVRSAGGWRINKRVSRTARTLTGGDLATAAVREQS